MPAKRIIILKKLEAGRFQYALWADVPAARQTFYARAGKVSAWSGASAAENAALASGAMAEEVGTTALGPAANLAQNQAALQAAWQNFQDDVTADNPWIRYGTFWDGTTWTLGGVA